MTFVVEIYGADGDQVGFGYLSNVIGDALKAKEIGYTGLNVGWRDDSSDEELEQEEFFKNQSSDMLAWLHRQLVDDEQRGQYWNIDHTKINVARLCKALGIEWERRCCRRLPLYYYVKVVKKARSGWEG